MNGRLFTYAMLALNAARCGSYLLAGSWARALYWALAFGLTATVEFFLK
jgi:uncharacterized membrane protein